MPLTSQLPDRQSSQPAEGDPRPLNFTFSYLWVCKLFTSSPPVAGEVVPVLCPPGAGQLTDGPAHPLAPPTAELTTWEFTYLGAGGPQGQQIHRWKSRPRAMLAQQRGRSHHVNTESPG